MSTQIIKGRTLSSIAFEAGADTDVLAALVEAGKSTPKIVTELNKINAQILAYYNSTGVSPAKGPAAVSISMTYGGAVQIWDTDLKAYSVIDYSEFISAPAESKLPAYIFDFSFASSIYEDEAKTTAATDGGSVEVIESLSKEVNLALPSTYEQVGDKGYLLSQSTATLSFNKIKGTYYARIGLVNLGYIVVEATSNTFELPSGIGISSIEIYEAKADADQARADEYPAGTTVVITGAFSGMTSIVAGLNLLDLSEVLQASNAFTNAVLTDVSLEGLDFHNAEVNAIFQNAVLKGVNMEGARFGTNQAVQSMLVNARVDNCDLSGWQFPNTPVLANPLIGAVLNHTKLDDWSFPVMTTILFNLPEMHNCTMDRFYAPQAVTGSGVKFLEPITDSTFDDWNLESLTTLNSMLTNSNFERVSMKRLVITSVTSLYSLAPSAVFTDVDISDWVISYNLVDVGSAFSGAKLVRVKLDGILHTGIEVMSNMFVNAELRSITFGEVFYTSCENLDSMFKDSILIDVKYDKSLFESLTILNSVFEGAEVRDCSFNNWAMPEVTSAISLFKGMDITRTTFNEWSDLIKLEDISGIADDVTGDVLDLGEWGPIGFPEPAGFADGATANIIAPTWDVS